MDIILISPYHGGSHKAWAEGYIKHSQHQIRLLTLPARFWKWRMHGGAVTLARRFGEQGFQPDLLLATDMLDLSTFLALTRRATNRLPSILYMHENQLTYPLPEDGLIGPMRRQLGERDQHYAFINYASMLAADQIWFNSKYHLDSFFQAVPNFLKHFPEYNELGSIAKLRSKSAVMPVGIDLQRLQTGEPSPTLQKEQATNPLILWNQRWEYDKNPEDFFAALFTLESEGLPFRLALCGRQYGKKPPAFDTGIKRLESRIIHTGHLPENDYAQLLAEADIVVSTAHHEFFGISIVEAIFAQAFPVLPNRLNYPELISSEWQDRSLYTNQDGLIKRLRWAINHPDERREIAQILSQDVSKFDWANMGPEYDKAIAAV